jgi:isopenicillin N synthase-like dioxygenase
MEILKNRILAELQKQMATYSQSTSPTNIVEVSTLLKVLKLIEERQTEAYIEHCNNLTTKTIPVVTSPQELLQAFKTIGFAAINPIDWLANFKTYHLHAAKDAAEHFFAQALQFKMIFHYPETNGQIGYTPFKTEKAKDQTIPDLKEFLHIPHSLVSPFHLSNFALAYNALDELGGILINVIAKDLKLPQLSKIAKDTTKNNSLLRVLHYPPTGANPIGMRAAEHEDINLLTLLPASRSTGLQIKASDGSWISAPTSSRLIIVNIGDMLQELTGGALKSTTHRVINTRWGEEHSRYSIPFFFHPPSDFILSERYTAREFLEERLKEIGLK